MERSFWELLAIALVGFVLAFNFLLPALLPVFDQHFIKEDLEKMKGNSSTIVIRGYIGQHGGYEPKVVRVKVNETVKIIFYGMDLPQSRSIDSLNLDTGVVVPEINDKKILTVRFNKSGIYAFRNTVPNGPMSPFQVGYIIVEGDKT